MNSLVSGIARAALASAAGVGIVLGATHVQGALAVGPAPAATEAAALDHRRRAWRLGRVPRPRARGGARAGRPPGAPAARRGVGPAAHPHRHHPVQHARLAHPDPAARCDRGQARHRACRDRRHRPHHPHGRPRHGHPVVGPRPRRSPVLARTRRGPPGARLGTVHGCRGRVLGPRRRQRTGPSGTPRPDQPRWQPGHRRRDAARPRRRRADRAGQGHRRPGPRAHRLPARLDLRRPDHPRRARRRRGWCRVRGGQRPVARRHPCGRVGRRRRRCGTLSRPGGPGRPGRRPGGPARGRPRRRGGGRAGASADAVGPPCAAHRRGHPHRRRPGP